MLIQQGDDHVGAQISTTAYQYALSKLCKTRLSRYKNLHPSARSSRWFPLSHDHTPFVSHAARLKKFWSTWDEMAQKRKHNLMKKRLKPADWIQLDLNYRATNDMLINCPCPRFARAARLTKVDSTRSLLTPSCSVCALLGKFRTYVEQVGARNVNARSWSASKDISRRQKHSVLHIIVEKCEKERLTHSWAPRPHYHVCLQCMALTRLPCYPWKMHHLRNLVPLKTKLNDCLPLAAMLSRHTQDGREWTGC